jgi:hypothetical protein
VQVHDLEQQLVSAWSQASAAGVPLEAMTGRQLVGPERACRDAHTHLQYESLCPVDTTNASSALVGLS